jgi:cell division protein FtsB
MRKRVVRGGLALVLVTALVDGVFGARGLLENMAVRRRHAQLEARIAELRQGNEALIVEIKRLREDPAAIEELAREELELMKDGELLVILRDAPSSEATSAKRPTRAATSTR